MDWITTSAILDGLRDFTNSGAWSRLVSVFRPALVGYGRRMGLDEAAAEDIAQAALCSFAEAYRSSGYDRTRGSLRTWLFGIAHRRVVDALRARARADRCGGLDGEPVDRLSLEAGTAIWQQLWERAVLAQCLDRVRGEVSTRTFAVFEASFLDQQPTAEVAGRFQMTENAVFLVRYRVLARLRQLGREFEDVD